MSFFIRIN